MFLNKIIFNRINYKFYQQKVYISSVMADTLKKLSEKIWSRTSTVHPVPWETYPGPMSEQNTYLTKKEHPQFETLELFNDIMF